MACGAWSERAAVTEAADTEQRIADKLTARCCCAHLEQTERARSCEALAAASRLMRPVAAAHALVYPVKPLSRNKPTFVLPLNMQSYLLLVLLPLLQHQQRVQRLLDLRHLGRQPRPPLQQLLLDHAVALIVLVQLRDALVCWPTCSTCGTGSEKCKELRHDSGQSAMAINLTWYHVLQDSEELVARALSHLRGLHQRPR